MSTTEVQTILAALEPLRQQVAALVREHGDTKRELSDVKRELVMARRHATKPYYTTAELQTLTGKLTAKATRAWAGRKGIPSHGHNQWDRPTVDTILGLD